LHLKTLDVTHYLTAQSPVMIFGLFGLTEQLTGSRATPAHSQIPHPVRSRILNTCCITLKNCITASKMSSW